MAKMFYTLDEAKVTLGKNDEEIKQLTREGKLREFRDGPRLMFKADQVEAIRNAQAGAGPEQVDLGGGSGSGVIGLADSKSDDAISLGGDAGSGSGLGSGLAAGGAGSGMMNLKEDTALAADLGMSGSMGGVPSPRNASGSMAGTKVGTRVGINVFGDDSEKIDPMAQTNISAAQGTGEHLDLQSVGSGSGLLDLTRESDDTSLGAELLDEIAPGGKKGDTASGMPSPALPEMAAPSGGVVRAVGGPIYVEAPDPMAPAMAGAALGAALVVLFGMFAVISSVLGTTPDLLQACWEQGRNPWVIVGGGGGLLVILCFFGGLIFGKMMK